MQRVGQTWLNLMALPCGSGSEGQHGLYFTVQRFCLISWRLFNVWTSYFGIMSRYDLTFDLKINVGHCDFISWSSDFALYLEDYLMYELIIWDYESVWPDAWPKNKCRSLWPIFHGPVILSFILKTIYVSPIRVGRHCFCTGHLSVCLVCLSQSHVCSITWKPFKISSWNFI